MLRAFFTSHPSKLLHRLPTLRSEVRVAWKTTAATWKPDDRPLSVRLVDSAPLPFQPYMKLMRLDRPIGSWLLFWPGGWGIATAAAPGCLPDMPTLALFAMGAVLMRGAGCTINDMWDRDIDSQVERTRNRPLVNGDVAMRGAWGLLAAQLSASLAILLQFDWHTIALGASSLGLVVAYPLMKRFTYWPQLVLGFTFNWGVLLGYSAVQGHVDWCVLPLYGGAVCWTIIYDTIYAHQDKTDDRRLGIKSTALKFDKDTKKWLGGFTASMGSMLLVSGIVNDMAWPYYLSIGLVSTHLVRQIYTLNVDNAKDCSEKFVSNAQIGFILFCGIVLGNLFKTQRRDNSGNCTVVDEK